MEDERTKQLIFEVPKDLAIKKRSEGFILKELSPERVSTFAIGNWL